MSVRRRAWLPSGSRSGSKTVHLGADRTRSEDGKQFGQLGRAETAGAGAVHGRHHAWIKDVHIQVDPVAVQAGAPGDVEDLACGLLHALVPDL
jgi:hypothetical protein